MAQILIDTHKYTYRDLRNLAAALESLEVFDHWVSAVKGELKFKVDWEIGCAVGGYEIVRRAVENVVNEGTAILIGKARHKLILDIRLAQEKLRTGSDGEDNSQT